MTNWWADASNTTLAVVWGGNPAENHPGVMQWLNRAVDNGGTALVIDPRQTRTARWAQSRGGKYVAIRPSTDSALALGVLKYAIDNDRIDWVFAFNFTDAAFKLNSNPLTSGPTCDYDRVAAVPPSLVGRPMYAYDGAATGLPSPTKFDRATCKTWVTAASSVFSFLSQRAQQYTATEVADITGMTTAEFNMIADLWTSHRGDNGQQAAIFYAMGGTQHSTGGEQLHLKCVLQLMLGNQGKMGSGVNALRGIHNVQGSTDMGLLKDSLPGYYPTIGATTTYVTFMNTLFGSQAGTGLQQNGYRNMIWWFFRQGTSPVTAASGSYDRTNSTSVLNFNHDLMPRAGGYNHVQMFQKMKAGTTKAFYACGQNPAVTEPNLGEIRAGLYQLDTLIVQDMYLSETAAVSRKGTGVTYLLPACAHPEEAGSVTSSARMLMWRYMATDPEGASKSDTEIFLRLAKALDNAGAFDHIPLDGGFSDRYTQLYGDVSQYGWDPDSSPAWGASAGTNTNGQPKYVGEAVCEAVYAQICGAQTGSTAASGHYGTLWIYAGGFDRDRNGTTYKYGTKLAAAAAAGATSLTVAHDVTSGKHALSGGAVLILGQYGSRGDKVSNWPDGGVETRGYDSTTSLHGGGNEERVTVLSVSGSGPTWTINLTGATTKPHAEGEPVTARGYWSYHANDGVMAKSRATYDPGSNSLFPRFGWAWLLNRRIFYNNNPCTTNLQPNSVVPSVPRSGSQYSPGYITHCEDTCDNRSVALGGNGSCKAVGDAYDVFVKPDAKATVFVPHNDDAVPIADYTTLYRAYNKMGEYDFPVASADWSVTNTGPYTAGQRTRLPKHWEPWETPRQDLRAKYGRDGIKPTLMGGNDYTGTVQAGDAALGDTATYPFALTTGRICWHFQGGPLSRNNPWLAELDSEAYVILNATDAGAYGIADGDDVYVDTKRGSAGPFKARVGVGPQSTQNVKQGVVWLPWHWGGQGLSTGPSANEVCIDALDKNSLIPESKACLCKIRKA